MGASKNLAESAGKEAVVAAGPVVVNAIAATIPVLDHAIASLDPIVRGSITALGPALAQAVTAVGPAMEQAVTAIGPMVISIMAPLLHSTLAKPLAEALKMAVYLSAGVACFALLLMYSAVCLWLKQK